MRAPVVPTFAPPERERSFTGFSVSTLLHVLLLFIILSPYFRRYHILSPNGTGAPGMGGGGGAEGQYIALPALRAFATPPAPKVETPVTPPVTPPPTVVPTTIPPPTPKPDSVPTPPASTAPSDANGSGAANGGAGQGGSGGGTGGGQGPGTGTGVGPGNGGGERGQPPQQRQMIIPPLEGVPRQLKGQAITIRFFVNSTGKVDRIETVPELPSGNYRRSFEEAMLGFKFRPAKDSLGLPVAAVAVSTVTLPAN